MINIDLQDSWDRKAIPAHIFFSGPSCNTPGFILPEPGQVGKPGVRGRTKHEMYKQLPQAKTEHERTLLQRQITATDNQIDQRAYALYGLTKEEIALVESKYVVHASACVFWAWMPRIRMLKHEQRTLTR